MLQITKNISIPLSEVEISYSRSSGPGGQNVNKVNSKVTLRWRLNENSTLPVGARKRLVASLGGRLTKRGECVLTSDKYRDQARNLADCLQKLRDLVLQALPEPKTRKASRPSRAMKEARLSAKKRRGEIKASRRKY